MLIAATGEAKQVVSKENANAREIILVQMRVRLATYVQVKLSSLGFTCYITFVFTPSHSLIIQKLSFLRLDADFTFLGEGYCRPRGCNINSKDCRVNGYYDDNYSEVECHKRCRDIPSCTGYSFNIEYPHRCIVYGNLPSSEFSGWTKSSSNKFGPATTSNDKLVQCFVRRGKKILWT